MKNTQQRTATRASVIAVRAALAALALAPAAVFAAEADQELMQPKSQIEVGVGSVSDHSAAFGEYNGLYKNGAHFIGNFDIKGGGGDKSAFRWRATGTDLGLATRNLGVEAGEQGKYRFNFGYDQLKRDFSDSFQTIYNGTGSNAHPTFAWETVTEVRQEDGLILLITGNAKGPHGEFWLEPDESLVVIRYPEAAAPAPAAKPKAGHGH